MTKIKLDIKNIERDVTIRFLVDCITVLSDVLILHSNGNTQRYDLNNYEFTIKGSVEL